MYKIINNKKLIATVMADFVGKLLYFPFSLFAGRPRIEPGSIAEILVIRTAYIGDVVMTIPVLKPLKEFFPGARITFLTSRGGADVLRNNPYVDEILTFDPSWFYASGNKGYLEFLREARKRSFDLVIEARGDIREILLIARPLRARIRLSYDVGGGGFLLTHVVPYPGLKHKVQYHLDMVRYLGCRADEVEWGVYLTPEEEARAEEILRRHGVGGRFVVVHPGTRLTLKRWMNDRYAMVYDRIMDEYRLPVVVLGTMGEMPIVDEIIGMMKNTPVSLAGQTDIRVMAGIIKRAALFICNDSAPMHIAAAVGTPTVAIFGPSKSVETGPYGDTHRVVEKGFPCRHSCDESTCLYQRFHACMDDIEVDDVMSPVHEILGERVNVQV